MGSHHPIRKTVAPEPVAIPDRLYFRIGDVARLCAVAPYVLRFWETEFPQLKPNKGGTGQRLYRKKDVETALRIKTLLYDHGYTIAGARQALRPDAQPAAQPIAEAPAAGPAPRPILHEVPAEPHDRGPELRLRAQLADLRDEIQSLITLLNQPIPGTPAAQPAPAPEPAVQLFRPRLVVEPKPAPKPASATTLHIAQGDLFSAE